MGIVVGIAEARVYRIPIEELLDLMEYVHYVQYACSMHCTLCAAFTLSTVHTECRECTLCTSTQVITEHCFGHQSAPDDSSGRNVAAI